MSNQKLKENDRIFVIETGISFGTDEPHGLGNSPADFTFTHLYTTIHYKGNKLFVFLKHPLSNLNAIY